MDKFKGKKKPLGRRAPTPPEPKTSSSSAATAAALSSSLRKSKMKIQQKRKRVSADNNDSDSRRGSVDCENADEIKKSTVRHARNSHSTAIAKLKKAKRAQLTVTRKRKGTVAASQKEGKDPHVKQTATPQIRIAMPSVSSPAAAAAAAVAATAHLTGYEEGPVAKQQQQHDRKSMKQQSALARHGKQEQSVKRTSGTVPKTKSSFGRPARASPVTQKRNANQKSFAERRLRRRSSSGSATSSMASGSSDTSVDQDDDVYEVAQIVDYWKSKSKKREAYLVKWDGQYSDEKYDTWEPARNLQNCEEKLIEFSVVRAREIRNVKRKWRRKQRVLKEVLAKLPTPPPAPLHSRAAYHLQKLKLKPISEEELTQVHAVALSLTKESHLKSDLEEKLETFIGKIQRFVRIDLPEFRKNVVIYDATRKLELLQKELKTWQRELNKIAKKCPQISIENEVDFTGRPKDFKFVNKYIAGNGVTIPSDPPVGCACSETDCLHSLDSKTPKLGPHCCPQLAGLRYRTSHYSANKKALVEPARVIYECNDKCTCGPECSNRVVQDGVKTLRGLDFLIFRTSDGRGWGVRTLKDIEKGTFVSVYTGEVITSEEAEERGEAYDAEGVTYLLDLKYFSDDDNKYTVDAARFGNVSHFFNHSCQPNLQLYNVYVNCLQPEIPLACLFATRDISKNEELTFDYLSNSSRVANGQPLQDVFFKSSSNREGVPCKCGSKGCLGIKF